MSDLDTPKTAQMLRIGIEAIASGRGKGGQNQNKRDTGVRIIHHPSGARAESREERSQLQNKRSAFTRMVKSGNFVVWMNRQLASGPTPEERVVSDLAPENLLVEVRGTHGWEPIR